MDKETHRQMDRIESKLDVLLDIEGIEIDRNGYPIYEPNDQEQQDEETETNTQGKIKQREESE